MKLRHILMIGLILVSTACQNQNLIEKNIFDLDQAKKGKVIVTINGTPIHQGLLDTLILLNPQLKDKLENPISRKKLLESLIEQQLLYQAALDSKLHTSEKTLVKLLMNQHGIIASSYIQEKLEEATQEAYNKQKDTKFTTVDISRIFVAFSPASKDKKTATAPTEQDKQNALERALAIKKRLDSGENFEKVAKETSDEVATKNRGGRAGQVAKVDKKYEKLGLDDLVKKAFELKKDQVSDPIATAKGYYIIQVTSDPKVTPFETAKRILGFELQSSLKSKLIEDLKAKSSVIWSVEEETKKPEKPEATTTLPATAK